MRASGRSELFFPFADHDLRTPARCRIDIEFIHQPFRSRQAEPQRLRCAEASRENTVQICNSRSMILKFKFHAHAPAVSQYPDSGLALLRVDPDVAAQLRSGRCQ